jgi:Na+-transporting NADH:ubiquinone oxidoreductase subunit A
MSEFRLKQGMDLPISGAPTQAIRDGIAPKSIGVVGGDYIGLKPKMLVAEGDKVARGTPLFCHKDAPNVMFTAPCKGRVRAIRRGARRVLESVIIDVDDLEDPGVDFGKLNKSAFNADRIKEVLQRSGLWNSFLTRPYSKMPLEYDAPAAIFVTAMESEPLAPDASLVLSAQSDSFVMGVRAIAELTQGRVYVCAAID